MHLLPWEVLQTVLTGSEPSCLPLLLGDSRSFCTMEVQREEAWEWQSYWDKQMGMTRARSRDLSSSVHQLARHTWWIRGCGKWADSFLGAIGNRPEMLNLSHDSLWFIPWAIRASPSWGRNVRSPHVPSLAFSLPMQVVLSHWNLPWKLLGLASKCLQSITNGKLVWVIRIIILFKKIHW